MRAPEWQESLSPMKKSHRTFLAAGLVLGASVAGCTLITEVDRGLIRDGEGGSVSGGGEGGAAASGGMGGTVGTGGAGGAGTGGSMGGMSAGGEGGMGGGS